MSFHVKWRSYDERMRVVIKILTSDNNLMSKSLRNATELHAAEATTKLLGERFENEYQPTLLKKPKIESE